MDFDELREALAKVETLLEDSAGEMNLIQEPLAELTKHAVTLLLDTLG